jgi:DNA end-binding protein Ku
MAPRANWKGHLKLSLVSCAVALYPATTTSGRVRFNIINRETGNRVNNLIVDAETGEPVEDGDKIKGYRTDSGRYILLEEDEIDRVALDSTHTIDIESFIPRSEIDPIYLDESYYIAPNDKVGVEAFAVIREAMERKKMVGLARVVLYRRERLLMLEPRGRGLIATTLRYVNEVRSEKPYFEDIPAVKIAGDMLDLAAHIIDSKKARFDPSKFEDRYEEALIDLIKAKKAGKELPEPPEPPPSNVINLMDALRRSVKAERAGKAESKATGSKAKGTAKAKGRKTARRAPSSRTLRGRATRKLKRAS